MWRNVQEVKDIYLTVNNIENGNKDMYARIENSNEKMSYAQISANNIAMPDVSENVPLIVKPKEKWTQLILK